MTSDVAREYANLRLWLDAKGRPIGLADTFIAAHARCRGLTLVTNNISHFSRVPGLRVEDWK
jgi:tRNA(fMet)-specific endonuclease VapC